jgi:RNA polymerase sigma factor (sigma-70 family)
MTKSTAAVLGKAIRAATGSSGDSDRELLRRFATGDQDAFAALFRRHSAMVLGVCRRTLPRVQDAEDACQATFLVLSRKAKSGRWQQSVANWLYLTARRVAGNARIAGERRARHEGRAAVPEAALPVDHMSGRELLAVLDTELDQLSAAYREPLVLCYLEGLTRDEAATRLGVPLATLKSRLERGRKRLGAALTKRGCVFGASLLALAATSPAEATPLRLVEAVLTTAAGSPPAVVAKLAEGIAATGIAKGKLSGLLALASAAVLGIGLAVGRPIASGHGPEPVMPAKAADSRDSAKAPNLATDRGKEISLTGRVLGTDGKPFPGAKLYLLGKGDRPVDLGASRPDGQFTALVPKGGHHLYLAAQADGFGCDFLAIDRIAPGVVELRLVQDHPVRGRVVDTQGKPVAGASVSVPSIVVYANDSLDSCLAAWNKRNPQSGIPSGLKNIWTPRGSLVGATTNTEGRFTLRGIGAERLAALRISGKGIADAECWVVNRSGIDPEPYNEMTRSRIPKGFARLEPPLLMYGPDTGVVVEAEKPIRGTVTGQDTGKGRPGVEVRLVRYGDTANLIFLQATTDAAGRYELHGARKEKAYVVVANGDVDAGYPGCEVQVADTPGYEPITADMHTVKGVIITGRVLDSSGKVTPGLLPSLVTVSVLASNPYAKDYPVLDHAGVSSRRVTADDGRFRVVTIPGPVLLTGGTESLEAGYRYKQAVPDAQHPQYFSKPGADGAVYISLNGASLTVLHGNWCKVLDIKPGTAVVEQDILFEPAASLSLLMRDAAGKPLAGVLAAGITPQTWYSPITCKTDTCTVSEPHSGKARQLVFLEPNRKLAAVLTLTGDEKPETPVTLRPAGSIKGRLIGGNGEPLASVTVDLNYKSRVAEAMHRTVHQTRQVVTGPDGSFVLDPVIPGLPFELSLNRQRKRYSVVEQDTSDLTVGPGEAKDLGKLVVKAREDAGQ